MVCIKQKSQKEWDNEKHILYLNYLAVRLKIITALDQSFTWATAHPILACLVTAALSFGVYSTWIDLFGHAGFLITVLFLLVFGGSLYLAYLIIRWKWDEYNNEQILSTIRVPQDLVNLDYVSGEYPIIQVNNGQSTLNINDWETCHVDFQPLDGFQRTSGAVTAYLMPANVTDDSMRVRQTFRPTGWNSHSMSNIKGEALINRGHLVGYSLTKGIQQNGQYDCYKVTGDLDNPYNLFTQTSFCNQELQNIYELRVKHSLEHGARVILQVQPVFRGTELMARGVHIQAVGTDGLDFNVYLFNVDQGVSFDYQDGSPYIDYKMFVPTPKNVPRFRN